METIDQVLLGDRLQVAWLMYIDCAPAVRVWTGAFNFGLAASGPDIDGGLYQGLGVVVSAPSLKLPVNGAFSAHTFSLSGVTPKVMALVNADAATLQGARMAWARLDLDCDGNPVAEPMWVWQGWVDSPRVVRDGTTNPPTRTVSLIAAAGSIRRRIRAYGYWTAPQQLIIDPNDTSCNNTAAYAAGTDTVWPY